mgnify:CR=1 FL=1
MAEDTTAKVVEYSLSKFDEFLAAAQNIISQYGGDAAELGLNALRIEALSTIAAPFIILVLTILYFIFLVKKHYKFAADRCKPYPHDLHRVDESAMGLFYAPLLIITFFTIVNIYCLLDAWSWVGIFYPELYAVHLFLIK